MEKLAVFSGPAAVTENIDVRWPIITDEDKRSVLSVLESAQSEGAPLWGLKTHNIDLLEKEFANYLGVKHALFTNSGTAALHMAVAAIGISPGDEVIVPVFSFISTATCVLHHNGIPIFVDVDPCTGLMDPKKIEGAITEKTKAIIVAHLHGAVCAMDEIILIAKKNKLKIIEDACQAVGCRYKGKKVGSLGDAAAFSLNGSKLLVSGEGGFFVSNNKAVTKRAGMVRSFGEKWVASTFRLYQFHGMGWMYRSSELTAAFFKVFNNVEEINRSVRTKSIRPFLGGIKRVIEGAL